MTCRQLKRKLPPHIVYKFDPLMAPPCETITGLTHPLMTVDSAFQVSAGCVRVTLTFCLNLSYARFPILYSCSTAFSSLVQGLHLDHWQAQ